MITNPTTPSELAELIQRFSTFHTRDELNTLFLEILESNARQELQDALAKDRAKLKSVNPDIAGLLLELYCRMDVPGIEEDMVYWLGQPYEEPATVAAAFARQIIKTEPALTHMRQALRESLTRTTTNRTLLIETTSSFASFADEKDLDFLLTQLPTLDDYATSFAYSALTHRATKTNNSDFLGVSFPAYYTYGLDFVRKQISNDVPLVSQKNARILPVLEFMVGVAPERAFDDMTSLLFTALERQEQRIGALILISLQSLQQQGYDIHAKLQSQQITKKDSKLFNQMMQYLHSEEPL